MEDDLEHAQAPNQASLDRYESDTQGSALSIRSLDDIKRVSSIFIESGMFKQNKNSSTRQQLYQAGVKIIAGIEFGIQPFAAMRGINIINGNAEMSANLMAAKVKKHPKYDYRVTKWDDDGCTLTFYEVPYPGAKRAEWDELGVSEFNHEHAVKAGLANGENWRKFARNMYFARAMSNGVRIHTPDVFYGAPVYSEGEISGEFDSKQAVEVESEEPPKSEPEIVEGEIIQTDELMSAKQLAQIKKLGREAGAGDDWFAKTLMDVSTAAEAQDVIEDLEAKLRQEPEERTWR